jgi:hypothetical protein
VEGQVGLLVEASVGGCARYWEEVLAVDSAEDSAAAVVEVGLVDRELLLPAPGSVVSHYYEYLDAHLADRRDDLGHCSYL